MIRLTDNKKGIAILMVAILVMLAIPVTIALFNLSTTHKDRADSLNSVLNLEQIAMSGMNYGYARLKGNDVIEATEEQPLKHYGHQFSGDEKFDLTIKPTGDGFFLQDICLMMSKASVGNKQSILVADVDRFARRKKGRLVITNDYWETTEPKKIGVAEDILGIRNTRGRDLLTNISLKNYEMKSSPEEFRSALESLRSSQLPEIKAIWNNVVNTLIDDKINEGNIKIEIEYDKSFVPTSSSTTKSKKLQKLLEELTAKTIGFNGNVAQQPQAVLEGVVGQAGISPFTFGSDFVPDTDVVVNEDEDDEFDDDDLDDFFDDF